MRGGGGKMVVSCHFLVGLSDPFFLWKLKGISCLSGQLGPSTWLRPDWKPQPKSLNLGGIIQKSSHQGPHWKVTDTLKTSVDCVRESQLQGSVLNRLLLWSELGRALCAPRLPGFLPSFLLGPLASVSPVSHTVSSQWIHFLLELARVGFCCLQFWTLGGKNAFSFKQIALASRADAQMKAS